MSTILIEAQTRTDLGKGASRRLRRLEQKVPGVVYGAGLPAHSIHLNAFKVNKVLEDNNVYTSVLSLNIDGKEELVRLKALQRHPSKPVILHMDFQRVAAHEA